MYGQLMAAETGFVVAIIRTLQKGTNKNIFARVIRKVMSAENLNEEDCRDRMKCTISIHILSKSQMKQDNSTICSNCLLLQQ